MDITIASYERINSEAMSDYFQKLRERYPKAPNICLVIDQGPYNISAQTKEAARVGLSYTICRLTAQT